MEARLPAPDKLRVVILDVDGTLYRQAPLRRAMAMRLLKAHVFRPREGWRTLRALSAYRHAQETMRAVSSGVTGADQVSTASQRAKVDPIFMRQSVERWMEQEPLSLLRALRYPGLLEFLQACRSRGIGLAALSDYPAEAKLEAMEIGSLFDVVLCAQSTEIGVFKPHPRGLQVALQRLGAAPGESLYVGDRVEVDAAAARAAGVCPVIIAPRQGRAPVKILTVPGYRHLQDLVFPEPRP